MKKPADIPVETGNSHSNTKKMKIVPEHETDYFTSSSENYNIECQTSDNEYITYDTKTRHREVVPKGIKWLNSRFGFAYRWQKNLSSKNLKKEKNW